jgi:hypothetical protein
LRISVMNVSLFALSFVMIAAVLALSLVTMALVDATSLMISRAYRVAGSIHSDATRGDCRTYEVTGTSPRHAFVVVS